MVRLKGAPQKLPWAGSQQREHAAQWKITTQALQLVAVRTKRGGGSKLPVQSRIGTQSADTTACLAY
jgi:hypothetical protein